MRMCKNMADSDRSQKTI